MLVEPIIGAFPVFFRVAACIMALPGVGSNRVPMRVKLYLALFVSLALAPSVSSQFDRSVNSGLSSLWVLICIREFFVGLFLGLLVRILFSGIEAAGVVISHAMSLSNSFGSSNDDMEQMPVISSILNLTAIMFLFHLDFHLKFLLDLKHSFSLIEVGAPFATNIAFAAVLDSVSLSFSIALNLAAPFIVLMLTLNLAVAVTSRLVQQVPIFFVSLPFSIMFGLFLLSLTCVEIIRRAFFLIDEAIPS